MANLKSDLFKSAHELASETRENFESYRMAFKSALKIMWGLTKVKVSAKKQAIFGQLTDERVEKVAKRIIKEAYQGAHFLNGLDIKERKTFKDKIGFLGYVVYCHRASRRTISYEIAAAAKRAIFVATQDMQAIGMI